MSLIIGAVLIDLLIGDPKFIPHPVEIMGCLIKFLREKVESSVHKGRLFFRFGGTLITFSVISLSALCGWIIEQLLFTSFFPIPQALSYLIVIFALASSLAAKSLKRSVLEIINSLNNDLFKDNLELAQEKLSHIVGRDVDKLDRNEILRATAESASENAVDGIFAPLFWMLIGIISWNISTTFPGPLAFAWFFKATSTIDSMLGYKVGNLRWIGESGARLDDILTFLPCRLVLISLPLISNNWMKLFYIIRKAWSEGSKDISPNSGISEAIFAHCAQVQMGGINTYNKHSIEKPILAKNAPIANIQNIKKILNLSLRLEILWIIILISLHLLLS
ncbi:MULTISPECIES: adenosylcobinamide-phosphate synthase CbiB [Prochlorococcus]|uniref:adenosylcobinamide-phosphate synthase CbiB n=1 Tax=Prochlorococcus TaxID=1218 RepID=UPI002283D23A|nr:MULTISPECIES: adenosylcobinamide-phosphate synthase CbiB [Prochlorococcus]